MLPGLNESMPVGAVGWAGKRGKQEIPSRLNKYAQQLLGYQGWPRCCKAWSYSSHLCQNQLQATWRLARHGYLTLLVFSGVFWHGFKSTFNFAPTACAWSLALIRSVLHMWSCGGPVLSASQLREQAALLFRQWALLALSNAHCVHRHNVLFKVCKSPAWHSLFLY
jgi:hypothetical protein